MRKWVVALALALVFLPGCGAVGDFETLKDVYSPSAVTAAGKISLELPEEAVSPAFSGESGKLYFCDGYCLAVETLSGGDLNSTLKILTGYSRDALTVMQTQTGSMERYDCVWTAAGENGDQVGKAVVLSDGVYHYCVSVMAPATDAGSLQSAWQSVLGSVTVSY